MQSSFVLRFIFVHALLSTMRPPVTDFGVVGSPRPPPSSSLSSAGGRTGDEGGSPGAPSRQLGTESDGFVSEWNKDWYPMAEGGGRASPGKCIDIPDNMTLCRGIGYDQMRLPNLLEHDSVREAIQQASSWIPLMNVRCHPDTQVFLCSLFAPVCLERTVWPCKTLCEAVKAGCETRMSKYGFPWPEMLRCEQFPTDNELCIGMRQENQSDESSCPACVKPITFEIIVDNFCNADYAMKIRVQEATVVGSDLKLVANKKKKVFKKGTLSSKELRDFTVNVENVANCDCGIIEKLKTNPKNAGSLLVMGHKKDERLVLSFIEMVEKSSVDMTKAMDAIRRGKICKEGMKIIASEGPKRDGGKGKTDKLRDNKSDNKKTETKRGKQEDEKSKTETKDTGRKKEDKKKASGKKEEIAKNGNKSDVVTRNAKQDEAKKPNMKNEGRGRNENGKRSTSKEPSNTHSAEKRNKQKEPKST